jgi:hypothetical protein
MVSNIDQSFILICTSVGWVSQFYDTCQVQFSQSNLQKGPIFPPPNKISKISMPGKGINIFLKKFTQFSQC